MMMSANRLVWRECRGPDVRRPDSGMNTRLRLGMSLRITLELHADDRSRVRWHRSGRVPTKGVLAVTAPPTLAGNLSVYHAKWLSCRYPAHARIRKPLHLPLVGNR